MIDVWAGLACAAAGASSAPKPSARVSRRMVRDMELLADGDVNGGVPAGRQFCRPAS